jgi:hypothetical protein
MGRVGNIDGISREEAPRTSYWRRTQQNSNQPFFEGLWREYLDAIPEKCQTPEGIAGLIRDLNERMDYVERNYGGLTVNGKFLPMVELDDVGKAIKKHKGHLGKAAQALQITRGRLTKILDENPQLRDIVGDVEEELIDDVEAKMFSEAIDGNSIGDRLYIMRANARAKARGYSERPQVEVGGDLVINLSFDGNGSVIKQLTDSDRDNEVDGDYQVIDNNNG